MFVINEDKSIYVTRGDAVWFGVSATDNISGEKYMFQPGDVVRMKVTEKKNCENVVLLEEIPVTEEADVVKIFVGGYNTKFGKANSKPVDYWYEVELEDANGIVQTIIGYDDDGAKIFKLYPEAEGVTV
jgi:hypothetical protein